MLIRLESIAQYVGETATLEAYNSQGQWAIATEGQVTEERNFISD